MAAAGGGGADAHASEAPAASSVAEAPAEAPAGGGPPEILGVGGGRIVAVIGATGRQGGATVRCLNESGLGWRVRAISRNISSPEAKALVRDGVELFQADCNDLASLVKAFTGCHGVYGVINPFPKRWDGKAPPAGMDISKEELQGLNIAEACKQAGVKHLVFSSVASAHENTGVETFESKWTVEKRIKELGVPCTVLAPVGFFENMLSSFAGIKQGVVPALLKEGRKVQMISTQDVGWFAAFVLAHPAEWLGKRLEIAGDVTCAADQAATLSRLRGGEPWKVSVPPDWVFKLFIPKPVAHLRTFLQERGTHVDVEACRRLHPGLMNFEAWVKAQGLDKKKLEQPSRCSVM